MHLPNILMLFTPTMMTITDFAAKRGISAQTVYSWIYRSQTEKHGFKVHQIGKVKLIEDLKAKKKKELA